MRLEKRGIMKTATVALALALAASSLFAGLHYRFQSIVTPPGMQQGVSGAASVDGTNMRLDIERGDQLLMQDHSFVVSKDGGRTLLVANPADKKYFELKIDDILGSAGPILKQLGGMVKVSFENEKVDVRDDGDGGIIEGYPTHKWSVTSSYDMKMNMMGQQLNTHVQMQSQTWATDKLPSTAASFVQSGGLKTGVEAIDKLIQAQTGVVKGFPLKQILSSSITTNGKATDSSTTVTVTDIHMDAVIPAGAFELPPGFTKGDSPLDALTKGIMQTP
jgi:hypothetical protein